MLEWSNRMALEQYGKKYRPFFVTLTYATEYLPDNPADCKKLVQKWLKRLRPKLEHNLRYFMVTETGTKKGRLHNHLLIWNEDLAKMSLYDQWHLLWSTWGMGRLESVPIRVSGGFWYVAKYITKNLTNDPEKAQNWNRRAGMHNRKGRLYSWSNRPKLGNSGINRWKELIKDWDSVDQLPPNNFQFPMFGKLHKVFIPKDEFNRTVKEMGYIYHPLGIVRISPDLPEDKREKLLFRWAEKRKQELATK